MNALMARKRQSDVHGVAVIDKPAGLTSHDVVQRARKALGQRRVGHAGTLDPMATGVLVLMAGEATKLGPYLTADDKGYQARVCFGAATDTWDAEGAITERAALPSWWRDEARARLEDALAAEHERSEQEPPVYSAIKIDGRSAHARTRAGETLTLAARPVAVRALVLDALDLDRAEASLSLTVSKGYYVRSLARDLGQALGLPAHLSALRRTRSGAFGLQDALALETLTAERLLGVADAAARSLPSARLGQEGVARARCGGPMQLGHFATPPPPGQSAWLDEAGRLIAIGERDDDGLAVLRGFNDSLEGT